MDGTWQLGLFQWDLGIAENGTNLQEQTDLPSVCPVDTKAGLTIISLRDF